MPKADVGISKSLQGMKINFKMSGGFAHIPALSRPFVIETENLDTDAVNQLESLLGASRFFEQTSQTQTPAKGAADYRTYTITVEDGARSHTIQLTDPIKDASLHRLVAHLQTLLRSSAS